MQTQPHAARGGGDGGRSGLRGIQPPTQCSSHCPKVMSFLFAAHFVSILCSSRGKEGPGFASAFFVFKWFRDFRNETNKFFDFGPKKNKQRGFSACARPLALEQTQNKKKKKSSGLVAPRASTKWKCSLISFIYPLPQPEPLLQIITPDVLNKLGSRAAGGTDCSLSLEADSWLHCEASKVS